MASAGCLDTGAGADGDPLQLHDGPRCKRQVLTGESLPGRHPSLVSPFTDPSHCSEASGESMSPDSPLLPVTS